MRSHCELSSGHEFQETLFNPSQHPPTPPLPPTPTTTSMLLPRHDQELICFNFFLNVIYSCYIYLSLMSWATCLVHPFIFLTCLSASEGICQIPLYCMPIILGHVHLMRRFPLFHLGIAWILQCAWSELVLTCMFVGGGNAVCEREMHCISSANWMC